MADMLDTLPADRVISWGEAEFTINKLLPVEAKALFVRHVRPLFRGALSAEAPKGDGESAGGWRIALAAFTDAPTEHYEAISSAMARSITVRRGDVKRPLAGNEEWAFQGLEGAHAMLLDGRAFLINFFGWWPVVTQEFPALSQAIASLGDEMQTPSS